MTVSRGAVIMMPTVKTLIAALWAPALAGILAIVVTWLVWYYTAPICTPENALMLKCRPTPLSRYLSSAVLHHCIIHASIATTIVGGSDLMLFIRERRRNEQMMELVRDALNQAAEERRQTDEARRQADEERRQANEEHWRVIAEERRQADAERRQLVEQAAEERQAFLEALNRLTDIIGQSRRNDA